MFQSAQHAGQRAVEVSALVGPYRIAEFFILFQIAVGIDGDMADLHAQPVQHILHQGMFAKRLQPLVTAAHAARLAAGQNQAGDVMAAGAGRLVRKIHRCYRF